MTLSKISRRQFAGCGFIAGASTFATLNVVNAQPSDLEDRRMLLSTLPKNLPKVKEWLVVKFIGRLHYGLMVPVCENIRVDVDWALRYGILCCNFERVAYETSRFSESSVLFRGASLQIDQPVALFQDFEIDDPKNDLPDRGRYMSKIGEIVAEASPYVMTSITALKFKGQRLGRAGFAYWNLLCGGGNPYLSGAVVFRDIREILEWRLHLISVAIPSTHEADEHGMCFTDDELDGIPRR